MILWTAGTASIPARDGSPAKELQTATWADEGTPWLIMETEAIVFNTDVADYIRQTGP